MLRSSLKIKPRDSFSSQFSMLSIMPVDMLGKYCTILKLYFIDKLNEIAPKSHTHITRFNGLRNYSN